MFKKSIILLGAIAVAVIIVSNATAVPQTHSESIKKFANNFEQGKTKIKEKIQNEKINTMIKDLKEMSSNLDLTQTSQFSIELIIIILILAIGFIIGIITWIPAFILSIPTSIIFGLYIGILSFLASQSLIGGLSMGVLFGGGVFLGGVFWPIACAFLFLFNV